MGDAEPCLGHFLVEWYGRRPSDAAIGQTASRLNDGADAVSAGGRPIRLLMALAIPTDDYTLGVFAAESADTVAQACAFAGAPADRISVAIGWPAKFDR